MSKATRIAETMQWSIDGDYCMCIQKMCKNPHKTRLIHNSPASFATHFIRSLCLSIAFNFNWIGSLKSVCSLYSTSFLRMNSQYPSLLDCSCWTLDMIYNLKFQAHSIFNELPRNTKENHTMQMIKRNTEVVRLLNSKPLSLSSDQGYFFRLIGELSLKLFLSLQIAV